MNLKELDKRICEILDTRYHTNEILNRVMQAKEINTLLRGEWS